MVLVLPPPNKVRVSLRQQMTSPDPFQIPLKSDQV